MPNPLSPLLHALPAYVHTGEVVINHVVELLAPFLLLMSRTPRVVGGVVQILFQVGIIISGNLSFLNYLTILPAICCLDDAAVAWLFSKRTLSSACTSDDEAVKINLSVISRQCVNVTVGGLIAYLSVPVVANLMSSQQVHLTRVHNTYVSITC